MDGTARCETVCPICQLSRRPSFLPGQTDKQADRWGWEGESGGSGGDGGA